MNYKSIIFDLDGTLLNTLDDLTESVNFALSRNNYPLHTSKNIVNFIGDGAFELVSRAMPEEKRIISNHVIELVEIFEKHYNQNFTIKTKPYHGIIELLDKLPEFDIIINILSNKPDFFTKELVKYYFGKYNFNEVMGENNEFPRKPEPDSALEIAKRNNVTPNKFIFVGDSGNDILTAKRAGMKSVGVSWGYRSKENLINAGAEIIIDNPLELIKYI